MKELTPIQEAWLKALESGEYQQGQGRLRKEDKFCCLGVLCDLAIKSGFSIRVTTGVEPQGTIYAYNSANSFLPPEICGILGIKNEGQNHLAHLNDDGVSFLNIAKEIRSNPERYFV